MIEPRPEIKQVVRVPDRAEAREHFVCLDKNERVDPWPSELLRELFETVSSRDLTGYPVIEPFREELAAWSGVPREWILLTSGSDAAIHSVFEAYLRPDEVVVLPRPTFAMYDVYCRLFQGQARELRYSRDLVLTADDVCAAVDERTRLVLLPNPNSPTGTHLDRPTMLQILKTAAAAAALVLVDEAYYYFCDETVLDLVEAFDNLVVLRTFSKAAGLAGVRLGYVLAQPAGVDVLGRVRPMYEISGVALRLGQFLIRHDDLIRHYARTANEGRAYLEGRFRQIGLEPFRSHANFVLVRLPGTVDIPTLVEQLRQRGYLIKGGFADEPLTDCIRITTGSVDVLSRFWDVFVDVYSHLV